MSLFYWVAVEAVETEKTNVPVKMFYERGRGIVLEERMNESEIREDEKEAIPEERGAGVEVCEDGDSAGGKAADVMGCPPDADAAEGAMDIVL